MGKACRVRFPVLPVKLVDGYIQIHPIIDTSIRHCKTVLIRTWDVIAFNAARLTETMLRAA